MELEIFCSIIFDSHNVNSYNVISYVNSLLIYQPFGAIQSDPALRGRQVHTLMVLHIILAHIFHLHLLDL